jgi:hypothetical protein
MDAKSHVCSLVFFFYGIDFWHLLCLSLIETFFVFPRLNMHSPSLIFDLPLSVGKFFLYIYVAFTYPFSQFSNMPPV